MPRIMPAKAPKTAAKAPAAAAAAVVAVVAPALVNITILRSHPLYGYSAGDQGAVSAADADFLVSGGFAQATI